MTSLPGAPTDTDWQTLTRLFADGQAAFRHRMGVSKGRFSAFYAPTREAAAIRAEKEAVLRLPDAAQYHVATVAGEAAFDEFSRAFERSAALPDAGMERQARHHAMTLALEPDWLLLAAPDWRLVWASVCFPTRWSLAGKAGLPLPDIHAAVPRLNQELGRKIDVFFGRLPPGEGWTRANWACRRAWNATSIPPGRSRRSPSGRPTRRWSVRVESQDFCKLPQTGAIAFGIPHPEFSAGQCEGPSRHRGRAEIAAPHDCPARWRPTKAFRPISGGRL